jgi:hypothetical protein
MRGSVSGATAGGPGALDMGEPMSALDVHADPFSAVRGVAVAVFPTGAECEAASSSSSMITKELSTGAAISSTFSPTGPTTYVHLHPFVRGHAQYCLVPPIRG